MSATKKRTFKFEGFNLVNSYFLYNLFKKKPIFISGIFKKLNQHWHKYRKMTTLLLKTLATCPFSSSNPPFSSTSQSIPKVSKISFRLIWQHYATWKPWFHNSEVPVPNELSQFRPGCNRLFWFHTEGHLEKWK